MIKYYEKIELDIINKLFMLTGIPISTIKKYGIKFLFEHPTVLKDKQNEKLELLKSFIRDFNDLCFVQECQVFDNVDVAGEYFLKRLKYTKDKEVFEVLLLNNAYKFLWVETLFEGTINESIASPREVQKLVLKYDASVVIVAHNHPGGTARFSQDDINTTNKLKAALKTIDVRLLDHVLVADCNWYSAAAQGLL